MSFDRHDSESELDRRVAREVESLLAYGGGEEHVEPLDDLARRRWIDTMLDEVETSPFADEVSTAPNRRNRGSRRLMLAIGGLAAAAALAIGLYVALRAPEPGERLEAAAQPEQLPPAKVMLSAGEPISPPDHSAVGRELAPGSEVSTGGGSLVIALPTGITLMLEPGTRLEIGRLDEEAVEVLLNRGELLASVSPGRKSPGFVVSTSRGRIVVTGTVFTVRSTDEETAVEVFRGAVQIEESGRSGRTVEASRYARLGIDGDLALEPEEIQSAKDKARLLDLLAGGGAQIEIRSVPSGAVVVLDGVVLGQTPLGAAVRPGHRDLDLSLEGHGAVRERLDLSRETTVDRVFELRPLEELAVLSTAEVDPASTATGQSRARAAIPGGLSPRELLRLAQSLRASKDWSGAAQAYQALIRRHPGTAEARTALVSLASIQLDHLGRASGALANYDAYLSAGGGALAPEALFGKARALRRLGRTPAEAATLRELLAHYPGAIQAPQAKHRLDEISAAEAI